MMRRATRSQAGAALVEFALLVPVMILLLVGLIECGRFAYYSILVANAARAGAQYGAQNLVTADDAAGMRLAALNDAQNVSGLTATATHSCQCADGSASTCQATDCPTSHRLLYVQVNTAGTYPSLFRFPGLLGTLNVTGQAVMQVDQ
jgi:Flp pilus assembly protein TadG